MVFKVNDLPDDLADRIMRLAFELYQVSRAKLAHKKAMAMVRDAAFRLDQNRHLVHYETGSPIDPDSDFWVDSWHWTELKKNHADYEATWPDIDFEAELTCKLLAKEVVKAEIEAQMRLA